MGNRLNCSPYIHIYPYFTRFLVTRKSYLLNEYDTQSKTANEIKPIKQGPKLSYKCLCPIVADLLY